MAKYRTDIGNSFNTQITVLDPDGVAVNITGSTVTMTIYDRNGDTLHQQVVTSHTTAASGITNIEIAKTETVDFPFGCYDYEIDIVLASGTKWTLEQGYFEVTP